MMMLISRALSLMMIKEEMAKIISIILMTPTALSNIRSIIIVYYNISNSMKL